VGAAFSVATFCRSKPSWELHGSMTRKRRSRPVPCVPAVYPF